MWYQNDVNLSFENEESVRNFEQEICEENGVEYDGSLPDWFKGAGYYADCELIVKDGETTYYDNGDVCYQAELADDIEIEVDDEEIEFIKTIGF